MRDLQEYDALAEKVQTGAFDISALRALLAELQLEQTSDQPVIAEMSDRSMAAIADLARKHAVVGSLEVPPALAATVGPVAAVLATHPVTPASMAELDAAIARAIEQVGRDQTELVRSAGEVRRLAVYADLLDAYMQLLDDLVGRRTSED